MFKYMDTHTTTILSTTTMCPVITPIVSNLMRVNALKDDQILRLSACGALTDDFIREFKDKLYLTSVIEHQQLSMEVLVDVMPMLDYDSMIAIIGLQEMTEELAEWLIDACQPEGIMAMLHSEKFNVDIGDSVWLVLSEVLPIVYGKVSDVRNLSVMFMFNHAAHLDWYLITQNGNVDNESKLLLFQDYVEWESANEFVEFSDDTLMCFYDKIWWMRVLNKQFLSEDVIRFVHQMDCLTDDEWACAGAWQNLPIDILEERAELMDWYDISIKSDLPKEVMEKFGNRLDWQAMSYCRVLPSDELEKHKDDVDWKGVCTMTQLTQNDMLKFIDYLDWFAVSHCQRISYPFYNIFKDRMVKCENVIKNIQRWQKTVSVESVLGEDIWVNVDDFVY